MRAILWVLCVAAIFATVVEQGNCAEKMKSTSAPNVTTGSRNASQAGNPINFVLPTNRTGRVRRAVVNGMDSQTWKRSVSFSGGSHQHNHYSQGNGACQSYKFLRPNEAKGHVFPAGNDINGETLGICRAVVGRDLTPGKYRVDHGACLVPWGAKEHLLTSGFKVLTMPKPKYFSWLRLQNGQVPPHAMAWGRASDGKPKYIARCHAHLMGRNTLVPGKIHNGRMTFAFDWKEYLCNQASVEVLTCTGA